ncbi:MAG: GIY-YIG nuclease family protein [Treponema sp.]|nr:GIY-YIG nuclease family protein [Treponema sp.]
MHGYMYILKCKDNSYYVGSTNNLTLRIEEHNNGEGSAYTKDRLPVQLMYYEECRNIEDAFLREQQIKGWSRKKKEALIQSDFERIKMLAKGGPSTGSGTTEIPQGPLKICSQRGP